MHNAFLVTFLKSMTGESILDALRLLTAHIYLEASPMEFNGAYHQEHVTGMPL